MTRALLLALSIGCVLFASGCCGLQETGRLQDKMSSLERRWERIEQSSSVEQRLSALEAALAQLARTRPASLANAARPAAHVSTHTKPGTAGAARTGGVYRQGMGTEPPSLDPAHYSDLVSYRVALNLFDGLVELRDDDLSVAPCIATSWTISEAGTVYTFRLRDGVRFHNGRACTAGDFVYSFARLLDPATVSERAWVLEEVLGDRPFADLRRARGVLDLVIAGRTEKLDATRVESCLKGLEAIDAATLARARVPESAKVLELAGRTAAAMKQVKDSMTRGPEALKGLQVDPALIASLDALRVRDFLGAGLRAVDDRTLRIELARPFAPFLTMLAMGNAAVVPHEEVERYGDQFARHPVGTGPFRFVSWETHVAIELEAFEGHFRGRPHLDRIRFRVLPDELARLNEFEIGNLESINEIPDEKYEAIKGNSAFPGVIEERAALSTFYIAFNTQKKPFDNPLVRQAFNYAARPEVMLDIIRHGRGTRAHGVLPPGMPGYNPELKGYTHDRDKALALLAQAGFKDPRQLGVIEYWYNSTSPTDPNAKLAEVFQQNLRELGIETKLQSCDWGTYIRKVDRGELPMFRGSWFADYPDPDNFLYILFHSSQHGEPGNTSFYTNSRVDELLLQGRTCTDPAKRLELYRAAEEIVVRDAPWIFLYHSRPAMLRKPYVHGIQLNAIGPDATKMRGVWMDAH